eukprot:1629810-Amphidinium_carterae.1
MPPYENRMYVQDPEPMAQPGETWSSMKMVPSGLWRVVLNLAMCHWAENHCILSVSIGANTCTRGLFGGGACTADAGLGRYESLSQNLRGVRETLHPLHTMVFNTVGN